MEKRPRSPVHQHLRRPQGKQHRAQNGTPAPSGARVPAGVTWSPTVCLFVCLSVCLLVWPQGGRQGGGAARQGPRNTCQQSNMYARPSNMTKRKIQTGSLNPAAGRERESQGEGGKASHGEKLRGELEGERGREREGEGEGGRAAEGQRGTERNGGRNA